LQQDKKWTATDPAPGNDTFRTRLLPLCLLTCQLVRPTNCAGLLSGNERRCAAGALFGRKRNQLNCAGREPNRRLHSPVTIAPDASNALCRRAVSHGVRGAECMRYRHEVPNLISLKPRRRFGIFAAVGKVARPAGRNLFVPINHNLFFHWCTQTYTLPPIPPYYEGPLSP